MDLVAYLLHFMMSCGVYMLTTRRHVIAGLSSILLDCCSGCHRTNLEPVTIMFMDPESLDDRLQRQHLSEKALRQFESETGIRVKHLPAPETSQGQLRLIRELLGEKDTIAFVRTIGVMHGPNEKRHVRIAARQVVDGWISLLVQPQCSRQFSHDLSSDCYTDLALCRGNCDGMIGARNLDLLAFACLSFHCDPHIAS